MTNTNVAIITSIIGLSAYTAIMIVLIILHKLRKVNSYDLIEENGKLIIKNSKCNLYLLPLGYFFLLSTFTILSAAKVIKTDRNLQLIVIYLICLAIAFIEFMKRKIFKVLIDISEKTVTIKKRSYSLHEYNHFEITDRRFWGSDQIDSYGLYIKNKNNSLKFIYGYSVYKDIENLKLEIEAKMNSR